MRSESHKSEGNADHSLVENFGRHYRDEVHSLLAEASMSLESVALDDALLEEISSFDQSINKLTDLALDDLFGHEEQR